MRVYVSVAVLVVLTAIQVSAGADNKADSYINLTAKGKLKTGVVAPGGETTGTILTTNDGTLELDIKDKDLQKKAESLNGKTVIVTGKLTIKPGVEVKTRHIVIVDSLKAEGEK